MIHSLSHTHVRFNHVRILFARKAFVFMAIYIHHFKRELHQIDGIKYLREEKDNSERKMLKSCTGRELRKRRTQQTAQNQRLVEYPTDATFLRFNLCCFLLHLYTSCD